MQELDYGSETFNFRFIQTVPWAFPRKRLYIALGFLAAGAAVWLMYLWEFPSTSIWNWEWGFVGAGFVAVLFVSGLFIAAWRSFTPVREWWEPRIDLIRFFHTGGSRAKTSGYGQHLWLGLISMAMAKWSAEEPLSPSVTGSPLGHPDSVAVWRELAAHLFRMGCYVEANWALAIAKDTRLHQIDEQVRRSHQSPESQKMDSFFRTGIEERYERDLAVARKRAKEWHKDAEQSLEDSE
jgi:hypothetical protein